MSIATAARTPTGTKFRTLAERLATEIAEKRRPMSQNPTHKRLREYHSRLFDADQLESGLRGLQALADGHDTGELPQVLLAVKTKAEVLDLMRLESDRTSDYIRTNGKYSNTTPIGVALQELVAAALGPQDDDAKAALKVRRQIEDIENDLRFQKIPGFFPTPKTLADQMATIACIHPGMLVLEPSAGLGDLADAVKRAQPHCNVHCIEIMPRCCDVLTLKGHKVIGRDVMDDEWFVRSGAFYDRIVMNPPYEKGQDALHVQRAFARLKPTGILVAIMSNGPFFRSDNASEAFRQFVVANNSQAIDVVGAFTGVEAFKQTGVTTKLLVMRKQS